MAASEPGARKHHFARDAAPACLAGALFLLVLEFSLLLKMTVDLDLRDGVFNKRVALAIGPCFLRHRFVAGPPSSASNMHTFVLENVGGSAALQGAAM